MFASSAPQNPTRYVRGLDHPDRRYCNSCSLGFAQQPGSFSRIHHSLARHMHGTALLLLFEVSIFGNLSSCLPTTGIVYLYTSSQRLQLGISPLSLVATIEGQCMWAIVIVVPLFFHKCVPQLRLRGESTRHTICSLSPSNSKGRVVSACSFALAGRKCCGAHPDPRHSFARSIDPLSYPLHIARRCAVDHARIQSKFLRSAEQQ